ncbi:MAG: hypothetical protein AAGC57_11085 [Pseudomonadota bacterium]
MLGKLALLAFVAIMLWRMLFHRRRVDGDGGAGRALPHPLDLVRCPRCGAHRLPGASCTCDESNGGGGGSGRGGDGGRDPGGGGA